MTLGHVRSWDTKPSEHGRIPTDGSELKSTYALVKYRPWAFANGREWRHEPSVNLPRKLRWFKSAPAHQRQKYWWEALSRAATGRLVGADLELWHFYGTRRFGRTIEGEAARPLSVAAQGRPR
jgi:hypothetical protein